MYMCRFHSACQPSGQDSRNWLPDAGKPVCRDTAMTDQLSVDEQRLLHACHQRYSVAGGELSLSKFAHNAQNSFSPSGLAPHTRRCSS